MLISAFLRCWLGQKDTHGAMSDYYYYYYYYYKCQDLSDAITTVAGALYKVYQ